MRERIQHTKILIKHKESTVLNPPPKVRPINLTDGMVVFIWRNIIKNLR